MNIIGVVLLLAAVSSSSAKHRPSPGRSAADKTDLNDFGKCVYELVNSNNIFDTLFSVPKTPKDAVWDFSMANIYFIRRFGIAAPSDVIRIIEEARDNFGGKFTPYKNFKAEVGLAEFYLQLKDYLKTSQDAQKYCNRYFQALKSAIDMAQKSGNYEDAYSILCTLGDENFYASLGLNPSDGRQLMKFYADEIANIRNS